MNPFYLVQTKRNTVASANDDIINIIFLFFERAVRFQAGKLTFQRFRHSIILVQIPFLVQTKRKWFIWQLPPRYTAFGFGFDLRSNPNPDKM